MSDSSVTYWQTVIFAKIAIQKKKIYVYSFLMTLNWIINQFNIPGIIPP